MAASKNAVAWRLTSDDNARSSVQSAEQCSNGFNGITFLTLLFEALAWRSKKFCEVTFGKWRSLI